MIIDFTRADSLTVITPAAPLLATPAAAVQAAGALATCLFTQATTSTAATFPAQKFD